eukprot:7202496-Pyramimonas_sp.AAC.1
MLGLKVCKGTANVQEKEKQPVPCQARPIPCQAAPPETRQGAGIKKKRLSKKRREKAKVKVVHQQ